MSLEEDNRLEGEKREMGDGIAFIWKLNMLFVAT